MHQCILTRLLESVCCIELGHTGSVCAKDIILYIKCLNAVSLRYTWAYLKWCVMTVLRDDTRSGFIQLNGSVFWNNSFLFFSKSKNLTVATKSNSLSFHFKIYLSVSFVVNPAIWVLEYYCDMLSMLIEVWRFIMESSKILKHEQIWVHEGGWSWYPIPRCILDAILKMWDAVTLWV